MKEQGKRRILDIGPGLIIALAVSIVLVGLNHKQAKDQPAAPPIVEHHIIASSESGKLGPIPEVTFITDRAKDLGLTRDQLSKIEKLGSDWNKFSEPKLAQANEAVTKTNAYLTDARGNRRTPVAQIEDNARPLIVLSGEISAARHRFWDQAMKLLTSAQRRTVQTEREKVWKARMGKPSGKK